MADVGDAVAAYLDQVRKDHAQHVSANFPAPGICVSRCAEAWPCSVARLAAAVEAVLKGHYKLTLYTIAITGWDPAIRCGHTEAEMENGRHELSDDSDDVLCLDKPEADVCAQCRDESGEQVEWPCSDYRAISAELLGEGKPGGQVDEHDILPRHRTPDHLNEDGSTTIAVQRCCNGCGYSLGDVTMKELEYGIAGLELPDVRMECPRCRAGDGSAATGEGRLR
jgi:hypothetical protein